MSEIEDSCCLQIRIFLYPTMEWDSRDSSVGIASGYGVGVGVPVGARIFTYPSHPDRLWGPHNLLCNGYWGLSPRG
jgi:hypothetical protein